jgi:hypothetical protein
MYVLAFGAKIGTFVVNVVSQGEKNQKKYFCT